MSLPPTSLPPTSEYALVAPLDDLSRSLDAGALAFLLAGEKDPSPLASVSALPHPVIEAIAGAVLARIPAFTRRLEAGARVVDVSCGSGRTLFALARRFRASHFVGYDRCAEAIDEARIEAALRGATNVRFEVAEDGAEAPHGSYDFVLAHGALHPR